MKDSTKIPEDERDTNYQAGVRSCAVGVLRFALQELGYTSAEGMATRWILEREAAISRLRSMCADLGDNDWPDDLDLSDIIDKHLWRHMETR